MRIKNIYPATTTDEDLAELAEMASIYLGSISSAPTTNAISAVRTECTAGRAKEEQ